MKKPNPINHWADQWISLPNQSDFHETVRDIFCTDIWFSNLKCYQEVPVIDLVPDYFSTQHRFDWYVKELNTILELHGEQHFKPTSFGSISYENKMKNFLGGQVRDSLKKDAALAADFNYVAIAYNNLRKLNGEYLKSILLKRQT